MGLRFTIEIKCNEDCKQNDEPIKVTLLDDGGNEIEERTVSDIKSAIKQLKNCDKCKYCGKPFLSYVGRRGYCSNRCRKLHRHYKETGNRLEGATCAYCGKTFDKTRANQKYCCAKCHDLAGRAMNKAKYRENHPRAGVDETDYVTCVFCGKSFHRNRRDQVYCSAECRYQAQKLKKQKQRQGHEDE